MGRNETNVPPERRVMHLRGSGELLGAEQVVLSLCAHSSRYGYEAFLAVPHDHSDSTPELYNVAIANNVNATLIDCSAPWDLRALGQLRSLVRFHGIDVMHCHGYREDFYAIASLLRVRKVATNHLWKRTTKSLRFYAAADSWLLRGFDRVIAVSGDILEEMRQRGIRPERLSHIPNGIDVDKYRVGPKTDKVHSPLKSALGIGEERCILVTIGSLTEEKGHRYLLHAIASVAAEFPNLILFFVGDGPLLPDLKATANALGLGRQVTFLGRREDVDSILGIADVFLLPSLAEGMPIALLEAMASGTPCVATDVGEVCTVLADDAGLIVPPADSDGLAAAIRKLVGNQALRNELGRRSRQRAADCYSVEKMAEAYCSVYDELFA